MKSALVQTLRYKILISTLRPVVRERPTSIPFTSEGYSNAATSADFMEYKAGVSYSYNTLNKAFLPTAGIRHRLSLDLSIPGSDLEYYTARYLGETYIPLLDQEDVSLKFKTRVGYGDGFGDSDGLPFFEEFFAGGIRTVSGLRLQQFGSRGQ